MSIVIAKTDSGTAVNPGSRTNISEPGEGAEPPVYLLTRRSSGSSGPDTSPKVSPASHGKVVVSPKDPGTDQTVTITTTPDTGYEVGTVTVTDKNGKTVPVTDIGGGKYTFVQPKDAPVTVKVTFEKITGLPFVDVDKDAYYYDAVAWAVENNVTTGTSATTFSPDASCTRAQMVTFLWRTAGSPKADASNPFTDVKARRLLLRCNPVGGRKRDRQGHQHDHLQPRCHRHPGPSRHLPVSQRRLSCGDRESPLHRCGSRCLLC